MERLLMNFQKDSKESDKLIQRNSSLGPLNYRVKPTFIEIDCWYHSKKTPKLKKCRVNCSLRQLLVFVKKQDGRERIKAHYKPAPTTTICINFPTKTQIKPLFISTYMNAVKQDPKKQANGKTTANEKNKRVSQSLNLNIAPEKEEPKSYLVVVERLNPQRLSTSMKVREWHLLKIYHNDLLEIMDFLHSHSLQWVRVFEDVKVAVENHEQQKIEGLERKRTVRVPMKGIGMHQDSSPHTPIPIHLNNDADLKRSHINELEKEDDNYHIQEFDPTPRVGKERDDDPHHISLRFGEKVSLESNKALSSFRSVSEMASDQDVPPEQQANDSIHERMIRTKKVSEEAKARPSKEQKFLEVNSNPDSGTPSGFKLERTSQQMRYQKIGGERRISGRQRLSRMTDQRIPMQEILNPLSQIELMESVINGRWKEAVLDSKILYSALGSQDTAGLNLLNSYQEFRLIAQQRAIRYIKFERFRLKGKRVVINASIAPGKPARLRFIFVPNDKHLEKNSEAKRLLHAFNPLRILNQALLSSQIVRGRHRYLSTVLVRVPFAILLQYRGYYCLVVELLTNDKGVGLGARPENQGHKNDSQELPYLRINSRYLDTNRRLNLNMVMLRDQSDRQERSSLIRMRKQEYERYRGRIQVYGLAYIQNDQMLSSMIEKDKDRFSQSFRTAPVILNNDDFLREQLCQMTRFLNLENIVCDGYGADKLVLFRTSVIPISRMMLPLAINVQIYPECYLQAPTSSINALSPEQKDFLDEMYDKMWQLKDQMLYYLLFEEEALLPRDLSNDRINLSSLLVNSNPLGSEVVDGSQYLRIKRETGRSEQQKLFDVAIEPRDYSDKIKTVDAMNNLTEMLQNGTYEPIDGVELHQILRQNGLGIRHLGQLYRNLRLTSLNYCQVIVAAEMYSRVLKAFVEETCVKRIGDYIGGVLNQLDDLFTINASSNKRLQDLKKKTKERFGCDLRGFAPQSYRLLILSRSLELMGINLLNFNYQRLNLQNMDAFSDIDMSQVQHVIRTKAYDFTALPLFHYAKTTPLHQGDIRSMRSALSLVRSERKRKGKVKRSLWIAGTEIACQHRQFQIASNLLKKAYLEIGYENPIEATSLASIPIHFCSVKINLAKQEIGDALLYSKMITSLVKLYYNSLHPVIASLNLLISRYLGSVLIKNIAPSMKPLFVALQCVHHVYGLRSYKSAKILLKYNRLCLLQSLYTKQLHFHNNTGTQLSESTLGNIEGDQSRFSIAKLFLDLVPQFQKVLKISKQLRSDSLLIKAGYLSVVSQLNIAHCFFEAGGKENTKRAQFSLKRALNLLKSYIINYSSCQNNLYSQSQYLRRAVECGFLHFLCALREGLWRYAEQIAKQLFKHLVRLDLSTTKENPFRFESWEEFDRSELPVRRKKSEGTAPQVIPKELKLKFNLKGRFMLALACFSVFRLKRNKRVDFDFDRGSLGYCVMKTGSFFTDFSFKFIRLQSQTNRTLESVYKEAVGSELSILEYIQQQHLATRDSELLDVLQNFQVDVV